MGLPSCGRPRRRGPPGAQPWPNRRERLKVPGRETEAAARLSRLPGVLSPLVLAADVHCLIRVDCRSLVRGRAVACLRAVLFRDCVTARLPDCVTLATRHLLCYS